MDVIIVGCGKAGLLHRNAYMQLMKEGLLKGDIYFIDKEKATWGRYTDDIISEPYFEVKTYRDIHDLMNNVDICMENTMVDMCLPAGTMLGVIEQFKKYGFKNYICEKPFVFLKEEDKDANKILEGLNIKVVENYLYSKSTIEVKNIITKYNIHEKMVVCNFSKNRRVDSSKYRGYSTQDDILTVWEVEVPHLIYLLNNLFGDIKKVIYKFSSDMKINDLSLKDHGRGTLICTNENGSIYIINSNLENDKIIRTIDVIFDEDYILSVSYTSLNKENLKCVSSVTFSKHGKVIESKVFEKDNNMYEMIKEYYQIFSEKQFDKLTPFAYIRNSSKTIEDIINEINSFNLVINKVETL